MINIADISKLNKQELLELEGLLTLRLHNKIKKDFWLFCLYWDEAFFTERYFLKTVAKQMQRIADGEIRYLAISMPPRAGKSYIATLFCAWILGNNPEGSVMRNSATSRLYNKFSYDARTIIRDDKYKKIFNIEMASDKQNLDGWSLQASRQVGYFGGGVGTTILGFGCNLVAILDDAIASVEEAMSENVLEKKWDWYTGVHQSRLEERCPEIHIATRWSKRDPIGRMEDLGEFDEVVIVPALDKDDKSFCEAVMTTKDYQRKRDILIPFIWNAEYQQQPVEVTGLLYPKDEMLTFDVSTLKGEGEMIAVVDVADKGSDFLSCIIAKLFDQQAYVIDAIFTQEPIEVTENLVAAALINNKVSLCRIESNSGGRSFAKNVETIVRNQGSMCQVEAKPTTQNKQTRMMIRSGMVREYVHFRNDINISTHYKLFLQQLHSTFKDVGKNKHDDAADSVTMLAELIESRTLNTWAL